MRGRISFHRNDVPYLSKERIESEAELLLAEYGDEHGIVVTPPIPVDEIIELYLGLTFEFKDMRKLFGVGDVHGALWLNEGVVGIDQSLDPEVHPRRAGRYHFTLGHEAGHWRLHRPYYVDDPDQALPFEDEGQRPAYICRSSEARKPVEWQADYFSACLLMPRELVRVAWFVRRGDAKPMTLAELRAETPGIALLETLSRGSVNADAIGLDHMVFERFVQPLAVQFAVSAEAMRIRLEELVLLQRDREDPGLLA